MSLAIVSGHFFNYNTAQGGYVMINNISSNYSTYSASSATDTAKAADKTETTETKSAYSDVAATYESSSSSSTKTSSTTDRSAIVAQLKADQETRMAQMQSLVTTMFQKQGITIGTADDMWKTLASGNFTADANTIAQAQADIAEDGYWGVSQTSDRLIDFAIALSGGDEEKMKTMVTAVQKGFQEATKSWGQDLPDISNQTYAATMKKFDEWFEQNGSSVRTEDLLK
jgi:hypothetical protein